VYRIGANKTVSSFLEPEAVVQLGLCRPLDQAVIQRELTGDHVSTIQAASHGVLHQTRNFQNNRSRPCRPPPRRKKTTSAHRAAPRWWPFVGHATVFHLRSFMKIFPDASSSNEAVHLQQRLRSLSTELVTLRNRLHVQGAPAAPLKGPRRARSRRPGHPADHPAAERPLRPRPCGGRRREPPSAAHRGGRPGRPHPPAGAPHRRRGDEVPPGAFRRFQLLREYWSLNRGDLGQHLSRRPGPALFTPDRELANKTTTGSSCIYIPSL
jgi:hypothetical protein